MLMVVDGEPEDSPILRKSQHSISFLFIFFIGYIGRCGGAFSCLTEQRKFQYSFLKKFFFVISFFFRIFVIRL